MRRAALQGTRSEEGGRPLERRPATSGRAGGGDSPRESHYKSRHRCCARCRATPGKDRTLVKTRQPQPSRRRKNRFSRRSSLPSTRLGDEASGGGRAPALSKIVGSAGVAQTCIERRCETDERDDKTRQRSPAPERISIVVPRHVKRHERQTGLSRALRAAHRSVQLTTHLRRGLRVANPELNSSKTPV